MTLATAWWVKSLGFLAIAAAVDLRRRTRPVLTLLVGVAYGLATAASELVKAVVDRPRPTQAHPSLDALVDLPSTASFPSGHAATSFACAVVLALLVPRLRVPVLALAVLISFSRLYLGVHYLSDLIAGALLGSAIAWAVVLAARRLDAARAHRADAPAAA